MYRYIIVEDEWNKNSRYQEYELLHPNEYTRKEFLNICRDAFRKLNIEEQKFIFESEDSLGTGYVIEILEKEYGFILPDMITSQISLENLHNINNIHCKHCGYSYVLNNKTMCNIDVCNYRELLNEIIINND